MTYAVTFILIICALFRHRSRPLTFLILAWTWIMLGWCSGNADYGIYLGRYNNYMAFASRTEVGYTYLMQLGNNVGLTYHQFLPLAMLVYVAIIGWVACKLSAEPAYVLALYLIFPACMEATQLRFTFATAFILLGFYFLFYDKEKKPELKYLCCIAIASSLHMSAAIFLLFVILRRLSVQYTIIYTVLIALALFLTRTPQVISWLGNVSGMSEKVAQVLATVAANYTYRNVIKVSYRCLIFFVLFMILLYYLEKSRCYNDVNVGFINNVKKANILGLVVMPLLLYSVDFYRIQQALSVLNYCALSYYMVAMKNAGDIDDRRRTLTTTRRRILYVLGSVAMAIVNLYYLVLGSTNFEYVFKPFFENNQLFR